MDYLHFVIEKTPYLDTKSRETHRKRLGSDAIVILVIVFHYSIYELDLHIKMTAISSRMHPIEDSFKYTNPKQKAKSTDYITFYNR